MGDFWIGGCWVGSSALWGVRIPLDSGLIWLYFIISEVFIISVFDPTSTQLVHVLCLIQSGELNSPSITFNHMFVFIHPPYWLSLHYLRHEDSLFARPAYLSMLFLSNRFLQNLAPSFSPKLAQSFSPKLALSFSLKLAQSFFLFVATSRIIWSSYFRFIMTRIDHQFNEMCCVVVWYVVLWYDALWCDDTIHRIPTRPCPSCRHPLSVDLFVYILSNDVMMHCSY